ncbi:MAG: N-acetylmuramoyl-L-alanine amidase [Selenomonadaceae bacterium]|nr:N-acetylmuramoyl-L-alanine amidase [Selenomonadaceae bacterium]
MALLIFTSLALTSIAQAAPRLNELQYLKTYNTEVDGKEVYRIEVGLKRENINYTVKIPTTISSIMVVDFENTVPGRLSQHNSSKISLAEDTTASVKEVKVNYSRLQLRLPFVINEDSYKIYIEKKPYRLIIDIDKSALVNVEEETSDDNFNYKSGSIVIDAGHGGSDSGAIGPSGVTEKEVTLAVALKVQQLLQNAGANVVMTRTTDRDVSWAGSSNGQELQARVDKTPPGAAVFVSIHCNAFSNSITQGMETYYYWGSSEGKILATLLNEELANFGGRFNRGVKGANFYVLKHTSIPASLVELAFITNPEEEYLLANDDYQQQLALAITRAIKRYLEINPNGNLND